MINLKHKRKLDSLAYPVIQNELLENIKFVEDFQTSENQYTDEIPLQKLSFFGKVDSPLELKHVLNDIFQSLSL